jgi:hypothetical protein
MRNKSAKPSKAARKTLGPKPEVAKPPDNWKDVIKKAIREKYALADWPKAS